MVQGVGKAAGNSPPESSSANNGLKNDAVDFHASSSHAPNLKRKRSDDDLPYTIPRAAQPRHVPRAEIDSIAQRLQANPSNRLLLNAFARRDFKLFNSEPLEPMDDDTLDRLQRRLNIPDEFKLVQESVLSENPLSHEAVPDHRLKIVLPSREYLSGNNSVSDSESLGSQDTDEEASGTEGAASDLEDFVEHDADADAGGSHLQRAIGQYLSNKRGKIQQGSVGQDSDSE